MNVQFKKGVLELCVLAVVNKNDCYGYDLVEEISKNILISDGTIYPLLRRLNKEGYFDTYLKESIEGPPRKYYKITEKGKGQYDLLAREWTEFAEAVDKIINEKGESYE